MKNITIVCRSSAQASMMLYFIVHLESAFNELKRRKISITPYKVFALFSHRWRAESIYYQLRSQPLIYEKR